MTGNILETAQPDSGQGLPDCLMGGRLMQGAQPAQVLLRGQQVLDAGGMADPQEIACKLRALLAQRLTVE
ncbi:hypothetical protein D3C76_1680060 [compost metagenome]